jgi:glycosyltransferase 2 family protein
MPSTRSAAATRQRFGTGIQLYASAQDERRARRPTDIALAIVSTVIVVIAIGFAEAASTFEADFTELVASLPGLIEPLWRVAFWAPLAYALGLLAVALVRRRRSLARDILVAVVVAIALSALIAALVVSDDRSIISLLFDVNGPPVFPPAVVVVSTAVLSTSSPHLSRPFRHFGRWLIVGQLIAALFLHAAVPSGAVAAILVGTLSAAIVHLVYGSPGGRPTESRIRIALAELGVAVDDLAPAAMQPAGVVLFEGSDIQGPLHVKVYGRDAWDAQMLTTLWRLVWYRGGERDTSLSRVDLVEHEGFVTLLAERAGVRVPRLVTAGSAGRGDALVVVRPEGVPLATALAAVDGSPAAAGLDVGALWHELCKLHDAGMVHRRLDLDRIVTTPDGWLGFGDLSSASVAEQPMAKAKDRAQLIGLGLLLSDEDTVLTTARRELGDERLIDVLPFLQEAAMPPLLQDALEDADIELDAVRKRFGAALDAGDQDLIKLRRVTWGSILNLALLVFAAYALIALLGDVDFEEFIDAVRDASWWWLAFAVVLAQLPRIPSAVSTMGSIARPLPLGPLTALQFAICFVNLAIPSTAARVAVNIRFFQRFGVEPTTAVSAGVIDSVSGFVVQIVLFVSLAFLSDFEFSFSADTGDVSGLVTIALIAAGVIVVAAVVVIAVRPLRARLVEALHKVRQALMVLKSPTKVLQLFGGNLLSQVLFGVALAACVEAFGASVPLTELVLINTFVSLFAGLLPIPGGIGVSEAGLTYGLTRAGLSSEVAFGVALSYRFASFYLPPIWGWFCYRWLIKRRYL